MKALLTGILLAYCSLTASAQQEIIEHKGNKYIIHVEQLNPDREMTLLDVLHICPELMSNDGKTLTARYVLSVDDTFLNIDYEPLLEGIKACDLSEVIVCTYGAVNNATDGTMGSIDLQFCEGRRGTLALSGSTFGNGSIYANVNGNGNNVTVRAFAQSKLKYGRANAQSGVGVTSHGGVENAMLFVDWQMTEKDLLKLKLSQGYDEYIDRLSMHNAQSTDAQPDCELCIVNCEFKNQRWGEMVASYEHTLNEQEASIYFETGLNYASSTLYEQGLRNVAPWWIAECGIPFLNQSLKMTAGYEGGYTNIWYQGLQREQNLYSDLYLQLDYQRGPWTISLGDRIRYNNFLDKHYNQGDGSLWSYNRIDHALHAIAGYHQGRHFLQGAFSRTYFNPIASDFHTYLDEGPVRHTTDYKTNLAWRWEARYTYQTQRLVATASVTHTLLTDLPSPNESLTGIATAITWHQGAFRLTAGMNAYRLHISYDDAVNENFYTLKFAPTLLLGKGFRLSSVLLYNSRQEAYDHPAHLSASVKMNKDLGKRCNLFADFHDIAGQPTGDAYYLMQSYKNRALTIGLTYYPWR